MPAMGKKPPLRPAWTENLGALIDAGATVRACCAGQCKKWKDIDLEALAAIKGRDYDLWNKRSVCRLTDGCEGAVRFRFSGLGMMRVLHD